MAVSFIDRGDLWKSKARFLRLQLREKFRVAVDRHNNRPSIFDNGSFLSTFHAWLQRFREFRRESLPSSAAFYRKRVSKDFNEGEESLILRMLQAVAVPVLGNVCHVFMNGLNRVQVYGLEKLHGAVLHRPKDKPLITVSNHVASMDDPLVISALLPPCVLLDARDLRWTLCASDRCFTNPATSAFFRSVKVLPVARGDGIYQKGMDSAISKLNRAGWVHIFPEGSRSRDGGKTMGPPKRGIGRLVLDADTVPIVVPFVHTGMQEIMPIGASIPRIGKTVTVLIGDPIPFDDLATAETEHVPRGKLYGAVASRIGQRLLELKAQVDKLALDHAMDLQDQPMQNMERAVGILQQIDWESFGIGSLNDDSNAWVKREPPALSHSHVAYTEQTPSDWRSGMRFPHDGGVTSRMRSFVDPTEFMSFAARGLYLYHISEENSKHSRVISPLKAWKQFLEANVFRQWNHC